MAPFLWVSAAFWLVGGLMLYTWGYVDSFLRLNSLHTPWLDAVMPHYTHLGDGAIVGAVLALFFIPRNKALALTLLPGLLAVLVLIGSLKRVVFPDWFRPPAMFEATMDFHYISLTTERMFTFPSGHSTAAAATFTFLGFFLAGKNRYLGLIAAFLAISAGYSRSYIGVHFFGDVVAGNLLGVAIAMAALLFVYLNVERSLARSSETIQKRLMYVLYGLSFSIIFVSLLQIYLPLYL